MSFENLVPGHALTEADIIGVLKEGESSREWLKGRIRRAAVSRSSYEDLIESAALRGVEISGAVPGTRERKTDTVYRTWQDANSVLREEAEYISREQKNVRFAGLMIGRIWDAFYRLDPQLQDILKSYYIDRECAVDIARRLDVSVTTFWRRRKQAVSLILRECSVYPVQTSC